MAPPTWIQLFCVLLSAISSSTGLEFYITRTPGSHYCANVECSYDTNEVDHAKFSVRRLSIYDITHAGNKLQLAYCNIGDAGIYIDPTKVHDINGTTKISKFHADIHMAFRNPVDCLYETLQCEVEYEDGYGKKQVVRKTIAPDTPNIDNDCSCSSITYQLDRLTNRANGVSRQAYGLTLNLDNLEVDISVVRNYSTELSEEIARVQESHQEIQESVNELREVDRVIDRDMNELRHNDSVLESRLNELAHVDQDMKETTTVLKQNDKNTDKNLNELTRSDNVQLDNIESLKQADAVLEDDINHLIESDKDLEESVNELRNESSSLRNQIVRLEENDNQLRVDIQQLASLDVEIQGSIKNLRETDVGIDRHLADLSRNDRELQEDAAQMQQATAAKGDEIIEKGQRYSALEAEIDRLEQYDRVIDGRISALKNKDTEIEEDLNALLRTDVILQQAIVVLQTTNDVHVQNIDYLRNNDTSFGLQITDLRVTDRVIDEQITELSRNNSALQGGLDVVRKQHGSIREELDSISNLLLIIESQVNVTQITTVSKTTSSLVLTTCTRGMPHDNSRASIVLFGSYPALCDTETDNGGWIVVLRRTSGDEKFYRTWNDYKRGFGNPDKNYFIGNEILANITSQGYNELRFDLVYKSKSYYAHYSDFRIDGETNNYRLHVRGYEGTAGDSFSLHDGAEFSTYDADHDGSRSNCAETEHGAWWYKDCYGGCNLNGQWLANDQTGVIWKDLSDRESVSFIEMKVRSSGY